MVIQHGGTTGWYNMVVQKVLVVTPCCNSYSCNTYSFHNAFTLLNYHQSVCHFNPYLTFIKPPPLTHYKTSLLLYYMTATFTTMD